MKFKLRKSTLNKVETRNILKAGNSLIERMWKMKSIDLSLYGISYSLLSQLM